MSADTEKVVATPTTTTTSTTNNVASNNNNNENEHLLEHKWCLWYRPPSGANQTKNWKDSQQVLFTAGTVEDFWRGYRKMARITISHPTSCDYSLFREGVRPAWEDDFNANGGRWSYTVERRQHAGTSLDMPRLIEQLWLDVMLCLIGESFEPYGESIAGGVCGIRAPRGGGIMGAKIHIWTKDADDVEANRAIGKILKECIHAPEGTLTFTPHERDGQKRPNHSQLKITL